MSGGLKQQWGVGEAAQAGSDAQSQELKTAFEKTMNAMAEHLQYTAANPAPPLGKGKGSLVVLGAFDLSRTLGGKPMDLAAMARKLKPLSDGRTGRLDVVAFWSEALGNDKDGVARKSGVLQNRASARASQTVAAPQEFFKPNFVGRIDQEVANIDTSPQGVSSESVGFHEMVVMFIP